MLPPFSRRFLPLGAALLVLGFSTSSAASPALVGQWKLDEGSGTQIADSSGSGNNGVLSGGATWVPGIFGTSALSFNGSSGQAVVPDSPSLEPTSAVTVSAWVMASGSPGVYRYIVAKGASTCVAASYGLFSGPNGGLQFYVSKNRGTTYMRSSDAGTGVWDGNWHQVIGSYDGSTIRLYVDGTQVGSGTAYPGTLTYNLPNSNVFEIGNYPGVCADSRVFDGDIEDVQVFDQALTPAQVDAFGQSPGSSPSAPTGGGGGNQGAGNAGGGTTSTPTGTPSAAPAITFLKLSSSTLTIGQGGRLVTPRGRRAATITYSQTQASRLSIRLLRSQVGLRRAGRCVRNTGRHAPRVGCSLFVLIDSYMRSDRAGRTTLQVAGVVRRRLTPGRYRLDVTPRAHGRTGRTVSVSFVVRRVRR